MSNIIELVETQGLYLVFDFKKERVLLEPQPHDIILNEGNEYLEFPVQAEYLVNAKFAKELVLHWLDHVNYRRQGSEDGVYGEHAHVVDLKQWRENQVAVGWSS
jgi:hypothetical protein